MRFGTKKPTIALTSWRTRERSTAFVVICRERCYPTERGCRIALEQFTSRRIFPAGM